MATLSAEYRDIIARLSRAADAGIRNSKLEETARVSEKYWRNWRKLAGVMDVDPYLDPRKVSYQLKVRALTIFGAAVREGMYGQGKQVARGTVSKAISAIGQEICMAGDCGENPVKIPGTDDFLLPIQQMLEGFGNDDPACTKKLPVEVDIPEELVKMAQNEYSSWKERRVADLALVMFYYLLRVGEYTSTHRNSRGGKKKKRTNKHKKKKTVNFRVCDVSFFKKDRDGRLRMLSADARARDIMLADGATLRLVDQKNGWKNVCIHQQKTGDKILCPVRALGRIILEIRDITESKTEWLSAFKGEKGIQHVVAKDISQAIKFAAGKLDYPGKRSMPIDRIDTHSLRAGGANALSLSGFSEHQIQKMGRWRSATFKEYISDQLSSFTDGMSKAMSQTFQFVNIAATGAMVDVTDELAPEAAGAA